MVGFAITLAFLCDFEAKRISLRRMEWLIPLYLVWSNIHGGMLGGLATLAFAIIGWTVAWKLGWESPVATYRHVLMLCAILLGCAATAFINPYGIRLPEAWLDIYRMQSLPQLIKEHAPLDLADRNAWMILLFGALYLGLLATTLPGKPRITWLLPMIWFILACDRVRHAPLFAIGALIAIADFFPRTSFARNWQARGSDLFVAPNSVDHTLHFGERLAAFALPVIIVVLALGLQARRTIVPVIGHSWAQLDPQIWPVDLLDKLKAHECDRPGGTRIFNEYAYGGYLIYHAPGYRVFVDGRTELYGEAFLQEFVNPAGKPPGELIARWEEKYGEFDYALVSNRESPCYADHFRQSPAWAEEARTDAAILFRRKVRRDVRD
jgi:hypothetical protein